MARFVRLKRVRIIGRPCRRTLRCRSFSNVVLCSRRPLGGLMYRKLVRVTQGPQHSWSSRSVKRGPLLHLRAPAWISMPNCRPCKPSAIHPVRQHACLCLWEAHGPSPCAAACVRSVPGSGQAAPDGLPGRGRHRGGARGKRGATRLCHGCRPGICCGPFLVSTQEPLTCMSNYVRFSHLGVQAPASWS